MRKIGDPTEENIRKQSEKILGLREGPGEHAFQSTVNQIMQAAEGDFEEIAWLYPEWQQEDFRRLLVLLQPHI